MNARPDKRDDRESADQRAREALAWVGRALANEAWLQSLRVPPTEDDRRDEPFSSPRAAA
jgi:hypothetical protein